MAKGTASGEEINRWNHWIEARDQNRAKAKQAIAEIAGFKFKDPAQPDMEEEWSRLFNATIGKKGAKIEHIPGRGSSSVQWIYRVAVILILGVIVGLGIYIYPDGSKESTQVEQITQDRTIRTGTGEEKTIRFSNGSKIIMNSNATVTYSFDLLQNQTIEVILEGEAYFEAESDPSRTAPMFTISTPDGTIRDIGTEFLVTVRDDHSRVVLQEGEVEVNTKEQTNGSRQVTIQKGQMLEFNRKEVTKKQTVNATFYTSWATGSMQFDETTIKEFANFVEQRFEVEVQIIDSDLADIKIDGGVYFQSLGELVRSVSKTAKLPVYQSEDRETVYIGGNDEKNNTQH